MAGKPNATTFATTTDEYESTPANQTDFTNSLDGTSVESLSLGAIIGITVGIIIILILFFIIIKIHFGSAFLKRSESRPLTRAVKSGEVQIDVLTQPSESDEDNYYKTYRISPPRIEQEKLRRFKSERSWRRFLAYARKQPDNVEDKKDSYKHIKNSEPVYETIHEKSDEDDSKISPAENVMEREPNSQEESSFNSINDTKAVKEGSSRQLGCENVVGVENVYEELSEKNVDTDQIK